MSPHAEPRRGPAEGFLIWQTAGACALAAWSLGGRAEGAVYWIAAACWLSSFALLIDPSWIERVHRRGFSPLGLWGVVLMVMAAGAFNAQTVRVDLIDGSFQLEARSFIPFLPAALEQQRAIAYSLLYSGIMVQAVMLWTFLRQRDSFLSLTSLLAANALILAIIGAAFRLGGADRILGFSEPVHPGFFASFRYHNHWTAFALLGMAQCAALGLHHFHFDRKAIDTRRKRKDVFWFSALILVSVTLPMSTARAGILFNTVFWGWVLYSLSRTMLKGSASGNLSPLWQRWRKHVFSAVLIGVMCLSGLSIWTVRTAVEERVLDTTRQIESFQSGGRFDPHRFYYAWRDTGRMIADAPITGWGIGNHLYVWKAYATDEFRDAEGFIKWEKEFAHNDWLQFIAELGIPAFLCLLAVPVILVVRIRKAGPFPIFSRWLLVGPLLVLMLAWFEFPLSNPAVALAFFVQVAIALKFAKVAHF